MFDNDPEDEEREMSSATPGSSHLLQTLELVRRLPSFETIEQKGEESAFSTLLSISH